MPVAYRVTSPTDPPQSREYVEVRSPEIPNLGARGQELEEISRSAHLSSERGSPGPALSLLARGNAGGISGDFSNRPPAKPRVRRGSISRDSKSGGQKTRTRRDIAIGASLFRAGFSRIVRLLAPDDPGLALAATTLAAAALAAASTAAQHIFYHSFLSLQCCS